MRGNEPLNLKPKALGVLWLLARRAGEVVTKTTLLDELWRETTVGEDALAFQIQALRRVLEDDAREPRYIATIHRVGYRFIAPVTTAAPPVSPDHSPGDTAFVGREEQLACLRRHHAKALRGERQLVLVSGEAGIGKTTLVESFLAESSEGPLVGRGQCVEQHGEGEGYLPVLEALGRICREAAGARVIDVLARIAPTWLLQLPAVLSRGDVAALQGRTAGATRERMLREIADALEVLSAEIPLILVLEDLHWSDPSTIEMLALVARRRERARLLVLGTYRPPDAVLSGHPLKQMKQELVARGNTAEIALGNLLPGDVRVYLTRRFPGADGNDLSEFVYRRTEGHPLFMVQMADYVAEQDGAAIDSLDDVVPHGLLELIEMQLGRLTDAERRVLDVASVAGAEFAVASVAAGAEQSIDDVEARCESLVRHGQFIEERGLATWPDGTVSGRHGFRHALYRDVLYRGLNERRRARLHCAIGTREEAGYGERTPEIAAELAGHFERGRDLPRAIKYQQQAGEKSLQRSANAEAIAHFDKGLALLETLPDTAERARLELRLRVGSSLAFTMTKGYSAPEVALASARARELCQQVEETAEISPAVYRVHQFYAARGEHDAARELAEELLRIAERAQAPALLSRAHTALAHELASRGDFRAAQKHVDESLAHYDPRRLDAAGGDDPRAVALVVKMWSFQVLGFPDQAAATMEECLAAAEALALPYASSAILTSVADLHVLRRASSAARETAEAAIALSSREGFPYFLARAAIVRGWALADQGEAEAGITEIREGVAALESMGAVMWMPRYLGLLAEACGKAGRNDEALTVLGNAEELVRKTSEGEYAAELRRLKGELTSSRSAAAAQCFEEAIAIAREQQAKSFELRATVSLVRSWERRDEMKGAHRMLADVYGWFSEGFETADLEEAKALLEELAA